MIDIDQTEYRTNRSFVRNITITSPCYIYVTKLGVYISDEWDCLFIGIIMNVMSIVQNISSLISAMIYIIELIGHQIFIY